MRYQLFLFLFLFLTSSVYSEEERNVNLSWLGFLNLPKKEVKEDNLVKVKSPKIWEKWSKRQYKIDWVSKSKKSYQEEIKFYEVLEISPKNKSQKVSRRRKRNYQR